MYPTEEKIAQIHERSHHYRMTAGQSRIVLIASSDLMGPAFEFVVSQAQQTRSIIEILYLKPEGADELALQSMMNRLWSLSLDFQITCSTEKLNQKMLEYHPQRQDILAVVTSASEAFVKTLNPAAIADGGRSTINRPRILIIGNSISA